MPTPFLGRLVDHYRKRAVHFVFTFKDVFYRVAVILFVATILIWLSIFMYGTFYYLYMPAYSHVRPVDLHFHDCETKAGICSYPSANVSLTRRFSEKLLARGQPYRVVLALEVPESPVNQDLGMFMVHISMKDALGNVIRVSEKNAMMRYRSTLLRWIYTLVASPFLLFGTFDEKQVISVEMFPLYEENPDTPTASAYVEVRTRFIQIYSAMLQIHAHFTGLRYLMFYYPWVTAFCGVSANLFFLLLVAAFSWHHWFLAPFYNQQSVVKVEFNEMDEKTDWYKQMTENGSTRKSSLSLEARRAELREKLGQRRTMTSTTLLSDARSLSPSLRPTAPPVNPPTHLGLAGGAGGLAGHGRSQSFSIQRDHLAIEEIPWEAVQQYQLHQQKDGGDKEEKSCAVASADSTCEEEEGLFMRDINPSEGQETSRPAAGEHQEILLQQEAGSENVEDDSAFSLRRRAVGSGPGSPQAT